MGKNRLTLRFSDPLLEQEFQTLYYQQSVRQLRIVYYILILFYSLFAFFDFIQTSDINYLVHSIRFLLVIPTFILIIILTNVKWFANISQYAIALSHIMAGAGIIIMIIKAPENTICYNGLILICITGYFAIRLQFIFAVVVGWFTLLLLFIGLLLFSSIPQEVFISLVTFYVGVNAVGSIGSYFYEKYERKRFQQHKQIIQHQQKLKTANAQLKQAKSVAELANKTKGTFLANMSHDIRTPLNSIIGFSYLGMDLNIDKQAHSYFESINISSKSLLGLLNDILDYSKIEANKIELTSSPFDIIQTLYDIINMTKVQLQNKPVRLQADIDTHLPRIIIADKLRISQIIINLLNNAVKFTYKGKITIHLSWTNDPEHNTQRNTQSGSFVKHILLNLTISDTGIGMDEEQLAHLYSAFTQGDASITKKYGGTGLGMSIVKRLLDLIGGSIQVASTLGEGTTFTCTIPCQWAPERSHDETDDIPASESTRIFIASHDAQSIKMLNRNLSIMGYTASEVPPDLNNDLMEITSERLADIISSEGSSDLHETATLQVIIIDENLIQGMQPAAVLRLLEKLRYHHLHPLFMVSAEQRTLLTNTQHSIPLQYILVKPVLYHTLYTAFYSLYRESEPSGMVHVNDIYGDRAKPAGKTDTDNMVDNVLNHSSVLLVEDQPLNQMLAKILLERMGIHVTVASSGEEAISMVQNQLRQDVSGRTTISRFDCILMDIQLPGINGFEATRKIVTLIGSSGHDDTGVYDKPVPIIGMSAYARTEEKQHGFEAGMSGYITKPIDPVVLKETLYKTLKH